MYTQMLTLSQVHVNDLLHTDYRNYKLRNLLKYINK
jgi:hypothetical protein